MGYFITITKGNDRKIVSHHDIKEEALEAGRKVWEESDKTAVVSCISGEVDGEGKIKGKYRLYESWFDL